MDEHSASQANARIFGWKWVKSGIFCGGSDDESNGWWVNDFMGDNNIVM